MVQKFSQIPIFRKISWRRFVLRCLLIVREVFVLQILLLFSLFVFRILYAWSLRLLVQYGMHYFGGTIYNMRASRCFVAGKCGVRLDRCRLLRGRGIVVLLRMCRLVVCRC